LPSGASSLFRVSHHPSKVVERSKNPNADFGKDCGFLEPLSAEACRVDC
jgi:hypothetical protein